MFVARRPHPSWSYRATRAAFYLRRKDMQGRLALVCSHLAEIGVFLAAAAALTVGMLGVR